MALVTHAWGMLTPAVGFVPDRPSTSAPGGPLTWTDVETVLRVNPVSLFLPQTQR